MESEDFNVRQQPDNSVKYKICKHAACLNGHFHSDKISGKSIAFSEHAEFHSLLAVNHPQQQRLLLSTIPVSGVG
ncbi:hypothetical protein EUGRSUZ_E01316 [Eucalyptus grandis]|uniref:Uncharacterized protein n=2 Tax=Eucalyptus grandis TaxID=71139 RepID=A0ACC3KU31_EUCGR|nr:hypothetical protein EUGRSUZ_E01316 [Eucalyptus grandis]